MMQICSLFVYGTHCFQPALDVFIANVKKMQDASLIKNKALHDSGSREKQAKVSKRIASQDVSSHFQKKDKLIPGDLKEKMTKWLKKQPKSTCLNTSFSFKVSAVLSYSYC